MTHERLNFRPAKIAVVAAGLACLVMNPVSSSFAYSVPYQGNSPSSVVQVEQGDAVVTVPDARSEGAQDHSGITVDVPIGTVTIGSGSVKGEPAYQRRTKAKGGMTIVEISATPFMPEIATAGAAPASLAMAAAPNTQPAGW